MIMHNEEERLRKKLDQDSCVPAKIWNVELQVRQQHLS